MSRIEHLCRISSSFVRAGRSAFRFPGGIGLAVVALLFPVHVLIGLYNRNRYIERLEAYKQVQDQQIGAIYIDLNGLKKVNDEQGHRAGDELIVRAAGTIAGIFAEDAYRVGGDEFVVILLDVSREDFARKTEQLRRQMQENSVDASIGGVWQASTENLEDLLRLADENMSRPYFSASAC